MSKYEKERTKTGGRKKGSKNKATILLEGRREEAYNLVDKVLAFVSDEVESGVRDRQLRAIDKLSPILPFVLPKLSSVDSKVTSKVGLSSIIFEDAKKDQD
jgi:hypothetical protein